MKYDIDFWFGKVDMYVHFLISEQISDFFFSLGRGVTTYTIASASVEKEIGEIG